jgi:hypothetical protein
MARAVTALTAVVQQAAGAVAALDGTARPSYVVPGAILLTAGLLVIAIGILLWRDTLGILTRFYGRVTRSWRGVPFLGDIWIRQTPFSAFRTQTLAIVLGGVLFAAVGIFLIARPS